MVSGAMQAGTPRVAVGQEVVPVVAPMSAVPVADATMPTAVAADTVTLRDGGVIRGTIAESFPGRHVVIVSAGGQRYTFEWDLVADVRYGSQAGGAGPSAQTVGPGRPRLHIELSREATVRLYELTGTIMVQSGTAMGASPGPVMAARPVCMAPCDKVIDASGGQSFFFGGDRVMPSRRFTLVEHDGDMTAVVKPGRSGVFFGGVMFASLGLAPLLSGAVFLGIQRPMTGSSTSNLHRTGGALLAVGTGLMVSGILMMVFGRTRVELYRKVTGAAQRRVKPGRM
jgi:hypothetical protein